MQQQRFSGLLVLISVPLILGIGSVTAAADVTGSFGAHLTIPDQSLSTEVEPLEFDIQNEINLTVSLSGLRTTVHSHFGLAGVEDVILTMAAAIGNFDLDSEMVFGRFDSGDPIPDKDDLAFITKRLTAEIFLGGVRFRSLAIVEDTNFPQTPQYAFGDVLSLEGQTTSGITVTARTGICASKASNSIKKHSWRFSVNPHCYSTPKPDLLFDFEDLTISGVPLAQNLTGDVTVQCRPPVAVTQVDNDGDGSINEDPIDGMDNDGDGKIDEDSPESPGCEMTNMLRFSGGIVPISGSVTWTDLFTFEFGGAQMTLSSGVGTLRLRLDDTGKLNLISVQLAPVLNPDSNPGQLRIRGSLSPGTGLTSASVSMGINRSGVDFETRANFSNGPPAEFGDVVSSLSTSVGAIDLRAAATFTLDGLSRAETELTLSF